jgi:catechol 2,3-dioxygenase-like lactoylglutathione lyase family enzyme
MKPLAANHLRIARPSHDLRASERFWVGGLGLEVLFRADESAEGGHALLMAGWPDAAWHLELVGDPDDATPAAPTEEDLLVVYVGGEVDEDVIRRLVGAEGTRVAARNPYWVPPISRSWAFNIRPWMQNSIPERRSIEDI